MMSRYDYAGPYLTRRLAEAALRRMPNNRENAEIEPRQTNLGNTRWYIVIRLAA